jgi:hypothetical protein
VDEQRFDSWTRAFAHSGSRRRVVRGLFAAGAALVAARRGWSDALARRSVAGPGDPCWDTSQCVGADAPLVCDWNGYGNDGGLNCCTYQGNRCGFDAACCGTAVCLGGICASQPSYASPGDPCQTTAQCNRPQTGAICEYTASTGDSRCCWYEGSLCSSGAQCCGSRVCAGGVCQFMAGGAGTSSGACTGWGCDCSSTPSFDPCDRSQGLICCSYAGSNQGMCLPISEYCGGGISSGQDCGNCGPGPCPLCASGYCSGSYCA